MPKNRRGLSSVVGTLFFAVLMISGFSVLSLALDAQTDIVTTQRMVSDIEIKKQQEEFGILASVDGNDHLRVSVQNQGQNPVEISSVWITNKTLSDQPAKRYSINYDDAFVSSGFTTNVLSSQALEMNPDKYDIKIVSSFGSIKTVELDTNGGGSSVLRAELITDPPDVIMGQNVTVVMIVTNTEDATIYNVHPEMQTPGGSGTVLDIGPHTPSMVDLSSGESVMFSWDTRVDGNSGDDVIFSANATGTVNDYDVYTDIISDTSIIRDPADGGSGSGGDPDPDIINDELLSRPKLFLTIPSSQGDSDDKALWGVNIANPVNAPMKVSKLSLTAFSPGANNNDKIFAASCLPENISPVGVNDWSCPSENIIMWQDYANPIIIPANSTQSFLVKIKPGTIAGQNILESIVVQASVFTNIGSFGKAGYQSTMYDGDEVIANVYLSNTIDSITNADIQSSRIGIVPGSEETFNIVLADLDTDDDTFIKSGAELIINIPKEWTDVTVLGGTSGFVSTPTVTIFGDGSSQIIGITNSNLGSATNVADTLQFNATAPIVGYDQMYVVYVLAQGQTDHIFSIGPLSEIVLQVDGS